MKNVKFKEQVVGKCFKYAAQFSYHLIAEPVIHHNL